MTRGNRLNTRWIPIVVLFASLCGSSSFASGTVDPADLRDLTLEELINVEVTVATLTPHTKKSAPSTITVFTRQEMINMGLNNLEELLRFVPGAYVNRNDLRAQPPVFRGHVMGEAATGVLVLLDNTRVNDTVLGGAFEILSMLSLDDVERVEIIRGPGSSIYGSNAMLGVINIVSRRTGNEIAVKAGSFESKEISGKFSHSSGPVKASLFARYAEDKGEHYEPFVHYYGEYIPTRDPLNAVDISSVFEWNNLQVQASYYYRKAGEFVSSAGGVGNLSGNQYLETQNVFLSAHYDWQSSENVLIQPFVHYRDLKYDWRARFIPASVASQAIWTNGAEVDAEGGNYRTGSEFQGGFDGSWQQSDSHLISFGGVYRHEANDRVSFQGNWDLDQYLDSDGTVIVPLPDGGHVVGFFGGYGLPLNLDEYYLLDANSRDVYGAYAQSELSIVDHLAFTGGLRFDSYQEIGSNISFRGGLVYDPFAGTTLKGMYGQAFRAPSIMEFKGEELATGAVGNPELGPEYIDTVELALLQDVGPGLLSITWFNNVLTDGIQNVPITEAVGGIPTLQPQNVGTLENSGLEMEIYLKVFEVIGVRAGGAYINNADPVGAASTMGFGAVNYNYGSWNFNVNAYGRGEVLAEPAGAANGNQDQIIASHIIWNSRITYDLTPQIMTFVSGYNLFDHQYRDYTTTADLIEGMPTRGQMVELGLVWAF